MKSKTILNRMKIICTKNLFEKNKSDIAIINKQVMNLFTALITLFLGVMTILSTLIESLNKSTTTYLVGFSLMAVFCLIEWILNEKLSKKSFLFVYGFWIILFLFLMYISLFIFNMSASVTLIMFFIIFPLAIIDKYYKKIIISTILLIIFVITGFFLKDSSIVLLDSLNILSSFLIGNFAGILHVIVKMEGYETQDLLLDEVNDSQNLSDDLKIALSTQQILSDVIMEVNQETTPQIISGDIIGSIFIKLRTIFNADRAYLYIFSGSNIKVANICTKEGVKNSFEIDTERLAKFSDVYLDKLQNGKTIYLSNKEELKSANLFETDNIIDLDVNKIILEPIIRNGELIGICGLDNPIVRDSKSIIGSMKTVSYVISDLIEVAESRHLLETLTYNDYLTRLGNRNGYEKFLQEYEENPTANTVGIIFSDLNGLKETNDTLGHQYGDKLIIEMGDILRRLFRKALAYRIGGDEFIVIFEDVSRDYFNQKVNEFKEEVLKSKLISASIGESYSNEGNISRLDYLIEKADINMYIEKQRHYSK